MITRMQRLAALSLALLSLVLGLGACSSTPERALPELGLLHLRSAIDIEPNAATARLQYGRIVARNGVQEQDPFCVFEIDTVSDKIQTVPSGRFRITGISRSVETFAGMPVVPQVGQYRPTRMNLRVGFGDDDSPTHIYYKTTFRLTDTEQLGQPHVRSLSCMSNQNAPGSAAFMRHLTMAEIRAALGDWLSLSLAIPPATGATQF